MPRSGTPLWQTLGIPKELVISPSQIDLAQTCLRKWFGAYRLDMREPDTDATRRGGIVHGDYIEPYLRDGKLIDTTNWYGRIAAAGQHVLTPMVGQGLVEEEYLVPRSGFAHYGYIDWIHKTERKVKDHKTTSDFKYVKTEEVLRTNPQVLSYGARALEQGSGDIEFEWIYYLAKRSKIKGGDTYRESFGCRTVKFIKTERELVSDLDSLDHMVRDLIPKRRLSFLQLPPSPSQCFKYNKPCHLTHLCTDLKPTIGDLMAKTKEELLAELTGKALGQAAPPGLAIPPPPGAAGAALVPPPPPATGAAPAFFLPPMPGATSAPVEAPAAPVAPPVTTAMPPVTANAVLPPPPGGTVVAPPAALPPVPGVDPAVLAAAANEAGKTAKPEKVKPLIKLLLIDCYPLDGEVTTFAAVAKACHQGIKEQTGQAHYRYIDFKGIPLWINAVEIYLTANPVKMLYVDSETVEGRDALGLLMQLADNTIRALK